MSNETESIELTLQGRVRDVSGSKVRRALPSVQRRAIGPFLFLDHFGPEELPAGTGVDIPPHPHIGLATVTYLFEGQILHRDSLGSERLIVPGDVNWMVAGRGIAHSERTPVELRANGSRSHGLQLWVGLPRDREDRDPSFAHHAKSTLPVLVRDGVELRVVAGTAFGQTSPVEIDSPLFYVSAQMPRGTSLRIPAEDPERAVYVVSGAVECEGAVFETASLLVLREGKEPTLNATSDALLMLFGGAPLDGKRIMWWNFVSSDPQKIERAKRDWKEGRFEKVAGDEIDFVPLPER